MTERTDSSLDTDGAPRRRAAPRAIMVTSVLGAAALGAVWLFRVPLAGALLTQSLADAGIASDFQIASLDLGCADLRNVKLGDGRNPDATAGRARVDFAWGPLPRLRRVQLEEPTLRVKLDEHGLSLGSLQPLLEREGGGGGLPDIALDIADGRAIVETPFGALPFNVQAHGRLRQDFNGEARLAPTSLESSAGKLDAAEGAVIVRTDANALRAMFSLAIQSARYHDIAFEGARLDGAMTTDLALHGSANAHLIAQSIASPLFALDALNGDVQLANPDGKGWAGEATIAVNAADSGEPRWRAPQSNVRASLDLRDGFAVRGVAATPHFALTQRGRSALAQAWPSLGAFPVGPLLAASRDATTRALSDAAISAPFSFDGEHFALASAEIRGASGATMHLTPRAANAPALRLQESGITAAGVIATQGGGLPAARLTIAELTFARGALQARGDLSVPNYRARGAALSAPSLALTARHANGRGEVRVTGEALMSGPLGGAQAEGLVAPLDISITWGAGMRVAHAAGRCLSLRFARLTLPGLTFVNGAAPVCAGAQGFYSVDERQAVSGDFSIAATAWSGHLGRDPSQAARLGMRAITARLSGTADRLVLDALLRAPTLDVRLAADHALQVSAPQLDAHLVTAHGGWRATGVVASAVLDDATLPARVTEINTNWSASPRGDDTVVRFERGAALLTSQRLADQAPGDNRPAFNPMRVTGVEATLANGAIDATGLVALEEGARRLGAFRANHVLESGTGEATVTSEALAFGPSLQPFHISELARGVVENVRGPATTIIHAHWTPHTFAADGSVRLDNISLSTATLPIIEKVSGEIRFDDLLAQTTPPGQRLTVGLINPGIAVRDGVIDFRLLDQRRVVIEHAEWPFAGGVLAVTPTTIALGAEETRMRLTLAQVDVATLLAELKVPDLVATGRVGGAFPLLLTAEAAEVQHATLQAEGAGTIAYAGRAGEQTSGVARMAFDALKSFKYENLSLVLNGDLGGDVLTEIQFRGLSGANVELPGMDQTPIRAELAGVPFVFNVRVQAPFRRLGELAAGAFDPRRALEQAREASPAPDATPADTNPQGPAPVDPAPPRNR